MYARLYASVPSKFDSLPGRFQLLTYRPCPIGGEFRF